MWVRVPIKRHRGRLVPEIMAKPKLNGERRMWRSQDCGIFDKEAIGMGWNRLRREAVCVERDRARKQCYSSPLESI